MTRIDTLLEGLTFPEGPRWRDGRLCFSDFYSHRVLTVDLDGASATVVEVPAQPSGLGWTPDGRLLVVSMLDRRLLRLDADGLAAVADLSGLATGPCNDMVVDAAGRAYVGNFGYDRHAGQPPRDACLARVDPDGAVTAVADRMMFPNGSVITEDGSTLIVAETHARRLTAFDLAADGTLANRRVFADLGEGYPDGICLDEKGAIWFADPRRKGVYRVREGGRVEQTISTGDRGAYACMLGGADRRTLFVCTSAASGPAATRETAGRIEVARVEVPGAGLP